MNQKKVYQFKFYGWLGLLMIAAGEISLIFQNDFTLAKELTFWTTPICWWGYLFFMDALIFSIKGNSLINNKTKEFFLQLFLSVIFWGIFEVYNLYLRNWTYINLPENIVIRYFGYLVSFTTIMPGMFMTAELLNISGIFRSFRIVKLEVSNKLIYTFLCVGLIFLIVPLLVPQHIAQYLFLLVWIGFILLLEPIAYSSGANSLLKDLENSTLNRILCLSFSGLICGFLWEFWNYWATSKWIYTVPYTPGIKIFEMPIAGFLGFIPFCWEFFVMYSCTKLFVKKHRTTFLKIEENDSFTTTIY